MNTGPGDFVAHVHEGLELADGSGFVAVSAIVVYISTPVNLEFSFFVIS